MENAREAVKYLHSASRASGDSLNTAEAGTIDALIGIGHALLALNETIVNALKDAE